MDLTVNIDNSILNVRVAGLIIHNNKILFHHNTNRINYALIGGRIKLNENSKDAVIREFSEEIGEDFIVEKFLCTIENFFYHKNKKYHEIMFLYKLEFKNDELKSKTETIHNKEGKDYLEYEWIDINEIDNYDIRPNIIKDYIKNDMETSHIINEE